MANFINPSQKLLVIETNNLQFGVGQSVTVKIELDESVVTATPTVSVAVTNAPFTLSLTNGNTSKPGISFVLNGNVQDYILGHNYVVTITANGQTDSLNIQFLLSIDFNPTNWTNTNKETNVGGFYTISQLPQGAPVLSTSFNSIVRSLLEYLGLLNFRVSDIINRYKIKRNLPDIINSAIFAGVVPRGHSGNVFYISGTSLIDYIILQDAVIDSDTFTKIKFSYSTQQKTILNNATSVATSSSYQALSGINIQRVSDATGNVKRYTIANVTVSRSPVTFTSIVDGDYSITMPLVTGWTVTE